MILFHSLPIREELVRIMGGDSNIAPRPIIEFTLFGYTQYGICLSGLFPDENFIPQQCFMEDTESGFDYYYWMQLENSEIARQYLGNILFPEYQYGPNVFILISVTNTPFSMSVTESLMNYLNSAYGLVPKLVTSIEDLYDIDLYEYTPFSDAGVAKVTSDMVIYTRENPTELSFIPEE